MSILKIQFAASVATPSSALCQFIQSQVRKTSNVEKIIIALAQFSFVIILALAQAEEESLTPILATGWRIEREKFCNFC